MSNQSDACGTSPLIGFTYLYVYVNVFDADVDAWQRFLRTVASPTQVVADGPVVERLAAAVKSNPDLPERIRGAVETIDDVVVTIANEVV